MYIYISFIYRYTHPTAFCRLSFFHNLTLIFPHFSVSLSSALQTKFVCKFTFFLANFACGWRYLSHMCPLMLLSSESVCVSQTLSTHQAQFVINVFSVYPLSFLSSVPKPLSPTLKLHKYPISVAKSFVCLLNSRSLFYTPLVAPTHPHIHPLPPPTWHSLCATMS